MSQIIRHSESQVQTAFLMQHSDNEQVIAGLKRGDAKIFTAFYDEQYPILLTYAVRLIKSQSEAEQIIQETFVKYWRTKGNFESLNSIKGFLFTCTRNACLNFIKTEQRYSGYEKDYYAFIMSQGEEYLINEQIRTDVTMLLYSEIDTLLPPKTREVFKLIYMKGLKPQEVAELLKISVTTVRNQRNRAVKLLKNKVIDKKITLPCCCILLLSSLIAA